MSDGVFIQFVCQFLNLMDAMLASGKVGRHLVMESAGVQDACQCCN